MSPTLSVIIPTLNAEGEIGQLLSSIEQQTIQPCDILVVDSSSDDGTRNEVREHSGVDLCVIERSSFNHGATRDMALRRTTGDIVCFLTQDAMPDGPYYLENLIQPMLKDSLVALSSGRQLPKQMRGALNSWLGSSIIRAPLRCEALTTLRRLESRHSSAPTCARPTDATLIFPAVAFSASIQTKTC